MFANVKVPFPGDAALLLSIIYTFIIYLHLLARNYASGLPVFIINIIKTE